MAQVAADKGQLCFLRIYILYFTNAFHCFVLINITTQAINGIGWINDHSPILQAFYHLFDQPWLRIFGMYLYQHAVQFSLKDKFQAFAAATY